MFRNLRTPIAGLFALTSIVVVWVWRDSLRSLVHPDYSSATIPLIVGTNVWPGYEPLYLARDLGLSDGSVRLVEYASATEVIRAFRNNLIDAGALTLDEVLLLRESAVDVRIVLITDVSHGGDGILAKPEIESLAHLRDRRVGVERTALGAYVLMRALQTVDLNTLDVRLVQVEADGHRMAYLDGLVDAVVTFEPIQSHLLKEGARKLFDSTQMPGEIVDVLVVKNSAILEKAKQVQSMVVSWFKALTYLAENQEDASRRIAKRLGLTPKEVLTAYDGLKMPNESENWHMLDNTNASSLSLTANKLANFMTEVKLLQGMPDLENLLSPQFLQIPPR